MTAECHRSTTAAYCEGLTDVVQRMAVVAEKLDPATRVPTCPDWNVGELTEHVGLTQRWACGMVKVLSPERIPGSKMGLKAPKDPAARPQWLTEWVPQMLEIFRGVDPDAPMWGWGSDKHARFWPRRMTHETTIHRADAEFAAGIDPEIDAALAVDGVDEFLDNLPHAAYFAPRVEELKGTGEKIGLRAADADIAWTIRLGPEGFSWDHEDSAASVTLRASAEDLYLLAWGRRKAEDASRFRVNGDRALLDFWIERSAI